MSKLDNTLITLGFEARDILLNMCKFFMMVSITLELLIMLVFSIGLPIIFK